MKKLIFAHNEIFKKASVSISCSIDKILGKKERAIIGIAGGDSISKTLDEMIKMPVSWENVHVFMFDERLVPLEHKKSNFRIIKEKFSDIILQENLHPFIFNKNKNQYGLNEYNVDMKDYGGECDIIIVSSGEDGHIGSLFPNHPSVFDNSGCFINVKNSPKPPPNRITMSKNMILRTKIGYLFIIGDNKKEAYKKFLDDSVDYTHCPSKLILHLPESYVITDIEKIGDE